MTQLPTIATPGCRALHCGTQTKTMFGLLPSASAPRAIIKARIEWSVVQRGDMVDQFGSDEAGTETELIAVSVDARELLLRPVQDADGD